jgi:hypothetical protein
MNPTLTENATSRQAIEARTAITSQPLVLGGRVAVTPSALVAIDNDRIWRKLNTQRFFHYIAHFNYFP